MFGSAVVEVAIGMVFSFLLLSLVASASNETVSSLFSLRAFTLQQGLKKLLNDATGTQIVKMMYDHPMISALAHPSMGQRAVGKMLRKDVANLPPYIPAHTFTTVLMDVMVAAVVPDLPGGRPTGLTEVSNAIASLPEGYDNVKRSLLTLIDTANGDITVARTNIDSWFNDAMERVSGLYKRRVQLLTAGIGLLLCASLNADSLMIADMLYRNSIVRQAIVTAATESVRTTGSTADALATLTTVVTALDRSDTTMLPIGWVAYAGAKPAATALNFDARELPSDLRGWAAKIMGFVLTLVALSLGAPFWFNVLGGVVKLRLDGEPPK